jgi:hypothetical protein
MFSFEDTDTYEKMMEIIDADGFPEWIKNKIESSQEYKALKERAEVANEAPAEQAPDVPVDDEEPPF